MVGPAPLSVSASSGSMTYGGSVPAITASYSGFVNGDDAGVAHQRARRARRRRRRRARWAPTRSSCSGASDANYTISYVGGTVQVVTAPLVIAASSPSMTYGGSVPTITAVVLGLRERGQRRVAHHRADVLDHGDVVEPGRAATRTRAARRRDPNYTITYVPGSTVVGTRRS